MEAVILFILLLEGLSNKKPVGKTDIQTLQGHPVEVNRKAHKEERIPKWLLIKNDSNSMLLPRIFFLSFWKTRKFKATFTEHQDLAFLSKEVVQYKKYYEAGSSLLGHTNNCGRISKKFAAILVHSVHTPCLRCRFIHIHDKITQDDTKLFLQFMNFPYFYCYRYTSLTFMKCVS